MNRHYSIVDSVRPRFRAVALACLIIVLAGCGGGGGGDGSAPQPGPASSTTSGMADFRNTPIGALYCVFGFIFGLCPDATSSANSSSANYCDSYYCAGGSGITYVVDVNGPQKSLNTLDIEPNNTMGSASLALISGLDEAHGILGFETDGTISASRDLVDTFIFTVPDTLTVAIQLCEMSRLRCDDMTANGSLDVLIAHIEVFNQAGQLIATTANEVVNGNLLSLTLDAGVPYYVSVVASTWWADVTSDYKGYFLRVIGMQPPPEVLPAEPELVRPNAPEPFLMESGNLMATIGWLAPTQNSDGSPLLGIRNYALYLGQESGGPYAERIVLDPGLSSYMMSLPDFGAWYVTMTAIDSQGIESAFSVELEILDAPAEAP